MFLNNLEITFLLAKNDWQHFFQIFVLNYHSSNDLFSCQLARVSILKDSQKLIVAFDACVIDIKNALDDIFMD